MAIDQNFIFYRRKQGNEFSGSDKIGKFLQLPDLNTFEPRFLAEGVTKIKHLADVTVEDLAEIGIALHCFPLLRAKSL